MTAVQTSANEPFRSDRRALVLAGLALVLAVLAAYCNGFAGAFVYDDQPAIEENTTIRQLWPIGPVLSPPRNATVSGRPVLNASFALNYAIGGLSVVGYHVFNVAIHALAALVLFGIVRRTLMRPGLRRRFGPASLPLALATAMAWAVHPLQTESVSYIVQRAESLMGMLFLFTMYGFIRYAQARGVSGEGAGAARPGLWFGLAVVSCLLGMATKEVMAVVPVLVLLYDRTFFSGSLREAWRRHRSLHLCLAATWVLLAALVAGTGGNRDGTVGFGVATAWYAWWLTQFHAVCLYLGRMVWPHPITFDYETKWVERAADVVPYALVVLTLLAATLTAWWRRLAVGLAGVWFFLILAPTSLTPGTIQTVVEHRLYLSLAGPIVLGVVGLHLLLGRRGLYVWPALVMALALLTIHRNADYGSDLSLWSDTVAKSPRDPRAFVGLGNALADAKRLDEAGQRFREAIHLKPDYVDAYYNLGNVYSDQGRLTEAVLLFETVIRYNPKHIGGHVNLGNALVALKRTPEAIALYETALRLQPDSVDAHFNLGSALAILGRQEEALRQFEEALRLNPQNPVAHSHLGTTLANLGRTDEAMAHYETALRLQPGLADAEYNLGNLLVSAGRLAEAIDHYESALRGKPDYAEAHNNLANALYESGRLAGAIVHYEAALRLSPDHASAHGNLGLALARSSRLAEAVPHFEAAVRLQPESAQSRLYLGNALTDVGRLADAVVQFEAAVRLQPGNAEARERLRVVREHLGASGGTAPRVSP